MKLGDRLTTALLKTTQAYIDVLQRMKIETVMDLLLYFPRTYEDISQTMTLLSAPLNQKVSIRGTVDELKLVRTRSKQSFVRGRFTDESGTTAVLTWFNQPHILRMISNGQQGTLVGKVVEDGYHLAVKSPVFENDLRPQKLHAGRIVAVYSQSPPVTSQWLREKIQMVLPLTQDFTETLPQDIVQSESLMSRREAVLQLHQPSLPSLLEKARERLAFEELFFTQRDALERKKHFQGTTDHNLVVPMNVELVKAFFESMNFTPTKDQKVALYEILKDMEQPRAMSRLLEGDVGSGKTLVAVIAIANALASRRQCALLVPTEVLARQHLTTVSRLLIDFYHYLQLRTSQQGNNLTNELRSVSLPRVTLLIGSLTASEKSQVARDLASGLIDVVIGTHAMIEDTIRFQNLGLVIVDEQHRFGVAQREKLREKGPAHFLSMTATPIPRTLALTAYGEHDLSVLLEKPGNRKRIQTKVVVPDERKTVEYFIDQQIGEGRQVYVICPLIEESSADEMSEVKSVELELVRLRQAFPHRRIAELHGRLSSEQKMDCMNKFSNREFDILVSTSVIEVGIDVPNTTIIVIEGAERFGLSQLHQFRGRVGRSDAQSYCFLFTTHASQSESPRLRAMEEHDSGFMLAEIDLKLRGPGEIFGLRQSGIPDLRYGSLQNIELVLRARKAAERSL